MNKPISTWTQTFYKLGYTLRRVWRDEPDYTDNYTPLAIEVLEDRQMLSGFGGDDPMSGGGTGGGTGGGSGEYGSGGDPTTGFGGGAVGGNNALSGLSGQSPTTLFSYGVSPDRINLPEYWNKLPEGYSYSGTNPWDFRPTHTTPPTLSNYRLTEQTEREGFPGTYIVTLSHYEIESFNVTSVGFQSLGNYEYTEHVRAKLTQTIIETTSPSTVRDAFESGSNPTFTSYIRFTATLEYKFNLKLLNGQTTSFDQNVVKEDTTTEFHWTTTNIESPFSEGEYLDSNYTRTSSGQASITGTVVGQTSIRVQAEQNGTGIAYTVSGNGRNWVPNGQELKTTIDHTATAQTVTLTVLSEAEVSDLDAFERLTIARGTTGKHERYSIQGDVTTKFDRSFNISSVNLRKSPGTPNTLTGSLNKTYTNVSTTENNLTITWLAIEAKADVIPLGDATPNDGASATLSDDGTAAVPIQFFAYRPAREGELQLGESTWLLNRDWSKTTDKDKFTVSANNRLRTEYFANGTRRDALEHESDSATDISLAQPLLRTVFDKNYKIESVSHEYFTGRRKVAGADYLYTDEETTEIFVDIDHQTGPTTTEVRARVSKLDNQPGYVGMASAQYDGRIIINVQDKTTHDIFEKETWKTEKNGPLFRTVNTDDVSTQETNMDPPLLVDSTARVSQISQNTRKEDHDDTVHIEYQFVDHNTVKIIDKSEYVSETLNYSGFEESDNYIKQFNHHVLGYFDYEYSDKTKEVITGLAIDGETSGANTILRVKNDTEVTMRRTPPSTGEDVQLSANATVTPITNDSTLSIDLSGFEFDKKAGSETVRMAVSSKSTYDKAENYGSSNLLTKIKTMKSLDSAEYTYTKSDEEWTRSGYSIDTVDFTKTTTFDYQPDGSPPLTDRERLMIVYQGDSTQTGEITDTLDKKFRQVVSSDGFNEGMTLDEFRSEWHSSNKNAVTGNVYFSDWTDNRNEANTMKTNVRNDLDLTYVVTELPEAATPSNSNDSTSSNNSNQGSSQHSGSNNSVPPTLSGNEPEIDESKYHSVVTGTKTELISNEIKTNVNSAFQQRLHGIQSISFEPSIAWFWEEETPLAYRESISRSASTDRKNLIFDSTATDEVKIRKSTEVRFEPDKVTVTINAMPDGEILGNQVILSKRIFEEYQGYIYETKDIFEGDYTFAISDAGNGTETASHGSGTHGMQTRSFVEWKTPEHGVFLRLDSTHETRVESGGLKYYRTIASNENQEDISRSTTSQQSELPAFDSTWVRVGQLNVQDTNIVAQANIGLTQTIVKWVMPNKEYTAYSLTRYTERSIKRESSVNTILTGNLDGTSKTRTVTNNVEEQNWKKQGSGWMLYIDSTWLEYKDESAYQGSNNGTYKEELNRERESFFTGTQETARVDNLTESISSDGYGQSHSKGKDGTIQIFESWAGTNTRRRADTRNSLGSYELGPEVVGLIRRVRRDGAYDQNSDNPAVVPDQHFSLGRLQTLDYQLAPPANFNSYTNYWGTVHAQRVDTFVGGVGMFVGTATVLTGIGAKVGGFLVVVSADRFIGGLLGVITAQQTESLLTMAAGGAYEWALQSGTNNPDFKLTSEERRAAGELAEFAVIFGAGAVGKLARIGKQFTLATQIFKQTTSACDDISKMGRAMKSFQEAGEVLAGRSDVHKSIKNILDNYCFVGTVDVSTYETENRWTEVVATPIAPFAATPALLRSDIAAGWIIIGAGAMALLQVFSVRVNDRQSEEQEEAYRELAWT